MCLFLCFFDPPVVNVPARYSRMVYRPEVDQGDRTEREER